MENCEPDPASSEPDVCDGLDTDCDGIIDEDFESTNSTCGQGSCASIGQTDCLSSQRIWLGLTLFEDHEYGNCVGGRA